jgi:hypothetical protein
MRNPSLGVASNDTLKTPHRSDAAARSQSPSPGRTRRGDVVGPCWSERGQIETSGAPGRTDRGSLGCIKALHARYTVRWHDGRQDLEPAARAEQ